MVCYFLSNQDIHNLLLYNSDLRDATAARSIWAWALECFNSSSANSVKHFWNAATRRSLRVFNSSYNQNETDHFKDAQVYSFFEIGKLLNTLHFYYLCMFWYFFELLNCLLLLRFCLRNVSIFCTRPI